MMHCPYLFLKHNFPPSRKVWRKVLPPERVYNRIINWDYFYLCLFIVFPIVMLSFHKYHTDSFFNVTKYFLKLIRLPLNISYPVCFSLEDISMGGHWSLVRCINNTVHGSVR